MPPDTKKLYCNGELILDASGPTQTLTPITNFAIGASGTHAQGYTGMLDDVRLFILTVVLS